MAEERNIVWHPSEADQHARSEASGQRGVTLWFTGLSGSGKSTISVRVEKALLERKALAYRLDGDNVRHGLNRDLGFGPEDRKENIRRVGEVAKLFADASVITLVAFISPYRQDRDRVRSIHSQGSFVEVHVATPLEICEQRDPKGLYVKARRGEIKDFTGIQAPYEEPHNAEITLHPENTSIDASAQQVLAYLEKNRFLNL